MKKAIRIFLILNLVFAQAVAHSADFDCRLFLQAAESQGLVTDNPIQETMDRFQGEKPDLENVLGWVAGLMGKDRDRFIENVQEQLQGEQVIREAAGVWERFRPRREGVRYIPSTLHRPAVENMEFFFEAIRVAFSKELGDASQWEQATPQERLRIALQFKSRATRVLLYEYKLYKNLRALAQKGAQPSLQKEHELEMPGQKPFHLLAPPVGYALFEEVRLTNELVSRLERISRPTEERMLTVIEAFVHENFVSLINDYYMSKPGFFRLSSLSVLAMMSVGIVVAYLGRPTLPPAMDRNFEGLNTTVTQMRNSGSLTPSETVLRQLQETQKSRALSEEEKIVLEALSRSEKNRVP